MESAPAELHWNIHRERQISSNSISGFQRSGSSKLCSAVLYCPNGAPKEKRENKMIKTQRKTELRSSYWQIRPAWNPTEMISLSLFFLTNENNPTAGSKAPKDEGEPTGTRGKTEKKTGSPVRETGVTSLTLASLPAFRRLKHGKQQKMRRRDTPLTTHGKRLTYTLR